MLANDAGIDPASLTVSAEPANGQLSVQGTAINYVPEPAFFGSDQFTYTVVGTNGDLLSATVSVTVNAAPIAGNLDIETVENVATTLDLLAATDDPDGTLEASVVEIVSVESGSVEFNDDGRAIYLSAEDFVGIDTIVFVVRDAGGAGSNPAIATITVREVTETITIVRELPVPVNGYASTNLPELGGEFLSSPEQPLIESANGVSLLLALSGNDVGREDGLIITNVIPPDGSIRPLASEVIVCDAALCTAYLPRLPEKGSPARGPWRFQLGTAEQSLADIDFSDITLHVIERRGPDVDFASETPAALAVRPILTATSLPDGRFEEILTEMSVIAGANGLALEFRPPRVLTSPQFREVSSDFTSAGTQALIRQGDRDAVNIFFLESFSGSGGTIGIAPGIPGELGVEDSYLNGVLVNATVTLDDPEIHARTTAEFAIHEMGHLLGLFHTTEADFTSDILADTPDCDRSLDSNNNNRPNTNECPDGLNIMFWTNDLDAIKAPLTDDQRFVLYHSPLAAPDGPAILISE